MTLVGEVKSEVEKGSAMLNQVIANIGKVIVGKRSAIELLCMAMICEGHVLIEDVPGTGKTTLALALSKTIGGSLGRVSCTPDVMPSDITGFSMYNPKTKVFDYHEGVIMANVFLADEINRTPPKTQSGLLEAMEEKRVTVDGITYELPDPFLVIATQNPVEYLGTYPLPEAQMDRFLVKVDIGYPTLDEEKEIIKRFGQENPLTTLDAVISLDDVKKIREEVANVTISDEVVSYIVCLIGATRNNKDILLGLSPRASLWLSRVAKAWAYYKGRSYVIPDDVKELFVPVCAHRITLRAELKYEHIGSEDILRKILNSTVVEG